MAQGRVPFNAVGAGGAPSGFDTPEAAFNAALLREQYRSLARLGPYVHGIVIVAALALFGATPTGSLVTGMLLPTALIAVSVFRLSSWFKARAGVELEALDRVRRKVRAASVLGPTLTFAFALTTAISTWQDGVVEFALALLAVWVVAAVCAMCLNRIAAEANVIVIAATTFLIVAFLARGSELTLGLVPLIALAAVFVNPLQWGRRARRGGRPRAGNQGDIRDAVRRVPARRSFDLRLWLCALSLDRRRAGRVGATGRRCALPRQGQRSRRRGHVRHTSGTHSRERGRLRERPSSRD
jgi:hypothetical protein